METPAILLLVCVMLMLPAPTPGISTNVVHSTDNEYCPPTQTTCEFHWDITMMQTMMLYNGAEANPVIYRDDKFYKRLDCEDQMTELTAEELATVITLDGNTFRYLLATNRETPGPTVVVYEDQEVVIKVKNSLFQQGVTIHWHGMHQKMTNWMDGVSGHTQCPINPHETFTYRFKATPAGTHWYHSHAGLQRADGMYGAFIVLPKPDIVQNADTPAYEEEFVMLVSEVEEATANQGYLSSLYGLNDYLWDNWNVTDACYPKSGDTAQGTSAAPFAFHSGVINGKGRTYDSDGNARVMAPLELYSVEANKRYRFRVINAASSYAFQISVDSHPLTLIASDGIDLTPRTADSFMIYAGERMDFYIDTDQTVGNYWIRAATLEIEPHHTLAILRYSGATIEEPSSEQSCQDDPCVILNCVAETLQSGPNQGATCVNFDTMTSPETYDDDATMPLVEYMTSFTKTESVFDTKFDSVNAIQYAPPSSPPAVDGTANFDLECGDECDEEACLCTNMITVPLGRRVQVTMFSTFPHPIHLHGYSFSVVKMGFPETTDIRFLDVSKKVHPDITCGDSQCHTADWTNSSWSGGNIPGINLNNPVMKDTVAIPPSGYVVIRFNTNNPGWWLMHCHIDIHFVAGMAVLWQTGGDDDMYAPPQGFPSCGSYHTTAAMLQDALDRKPGSDRPKPCTSSGHVVFPSLSVLFIAVLAQLLRA